MAKYFRFLSLPVELRLEIYYYLLVFVQGPIYLTRRRRGVHALGDQSPFLHPNILRTCSLLYHEAASVLYGKNTFDLLSRHKTAFLKQIGHDNSILIRHARLGFEIEGVRDRGKWISVQHFPSLSCRYSWAANFLRKYCPNLATITFHTQGWISPLELPPEKAFEFFESAVNFFKRNLPRLMRVWAPHIARNQNPWTRATLLAKEEGPKYSWDNICDFLEGNGWVLGKYR